VYENGVWVDGTMSMEGGHQISNLGHGTSMERSSRSSEEMRLPTEMMIQEKERERTYEWMNSAYISRLNGGTQHVEQYVTITYSLQSRD
jgi:hypothetical protein